MGTPPIRRAMTSRLSWLGRLELPQKAQVVLEEEPQIVDAIAQHGDAIDAHAPREAGVSLGIHTGGLQHVRMDHAASRDLEPARLLADAATRAVAEHAGHIYFGRRLGER